MKRIIFSILCIAVFSLSCSIAEATMLDKVKESWRVKMPYDTTEKILLGGVYAGQIGDYVSTKNALSGTKCHEANPIFGEDPSDGTIIAAKVFTSLLFTWIGNNQTNHTTRKLFLGFGTAIGLGVTYHNNSLDCE